MKNIQKDFRKCRVGMDAVVSTTVLLADINDFMNMTKCMESICFSLSSVWRSKQQPLPKNALVEIQAIGCKRINDQSTCVIWRCFFCWGFSSMRYCDKIRKQEEKSVMSAGYRTTKKNQNYGPGILGIVWGDHLCGNRLISCRIFF